MGVEDAAVDAGICDGAGGSGCCCWMGAVVVTLCITGMELAVEV